MCRRIIIHLPHLKWIQKNQNSSEADVNAAKQSSEPDKETKLDEILHSAKYPGQLKELAKKMMRQLTSYMSILRSIRKSMILI